MAEFDIITDARSRSPVRQAPPRPDMVWIPGGTFRMGRTGTTRKRRRPIA
jgi:hypothetical protein